MAVFSFLFMNRGLEKWFAQIPENVRSAARSLEQMSVEDRTLKLEQATAMLVGLPLALRHRRLRKKEVV